MFVPLEKELLDIFNEIVPSLRKHVAVKYDILVRYLNNEKVIEAVSNEGNIRILTRKKPELECQQYSLTLQVEKLKDTFEHTGLEHKIFAFGSLINTEGEKVLSKRWYPLPRKNIQDLCDLCYKIYENALK